MTLIDFGDWCKKNSVIAQPFVAEGPDLESVLIAACLAVEAFRKTGKVPK